MWSNTRIYCMSSGSRFPTVPDVFPSSSDSDCPVSIRNYSLDEQPQTKTGVKVEPFPENFGMSESELA